MSPPAFLFLATETRFTPEGQGQRTRSWHISWTVRHARHSLRSSRCFAGSSSPFGENDMVSLWGSTVIGLFCVRGALARGHSLCTAASGCSYRAPSGLVAVVSLKTSFALEARTRRMLSREKGGLLSAARENDYAQAGYRRVFATKDGSTQLEMDKAFWPLSRSVG